MNVHLSRGQCRWQGWLAKLSAGRCQGSSSSTARQDHRAAARAHCGLDSVAGRGRQPRDEAWYSPTATAASTLASTSRRSVRRCPPLLLHSSTATSGSSASTPTTCPSRSGQQRLHGGARWPWLARTLASLRKQPALTSSWLTSTIAPTAPAPCTAPRAARGSSSFRCLIPTALTWSSRSQPHLRAHGSAPGGVATRLDRRDRPPGCRGHYLHRGRRRRRGPL